MTVTSSAPIFFTAVLEGLTAKILQSGILAENPADLQPEVIENSQVEVESAAEANTWNCSVCTFLNAAKSIQCNVCETIRPNGWSADAECDCWTCPVCTFINSQHASR